MKNSTLLFVLFILLPAIGSCEKKVEELRISDGFNLVLDDSITLTSEDIDFYDFSSQLIYLSNKEFAYTTSGEFSVFVDNELIYTGQIYPGYMSLLPTGPVIHCAPTFYENFIIP